MKTIDIIKSLIGNRKIKDVSEQSGIPFNTISNWINGRCEPSYFNMQKLAKACNSRIVVESLDSVFKVVVECVSFDIHSSLYLGELDPRCMTVGTAEIYYLDEVNSVFDVSETHMTGYLDVQTEVTITPDGYDFKPTHIIYMNESIELDEIDSGRIKKAIKDDDTLFYQVDDFHTEYHNGTLNQYQLDQARL